MKNTIFLTLFYCVVAVSAFLASPPTNTCVYHQSKNTHYAATLSSKASSAADYLEDGKNKADMDALKSEIEQLKDQVSQKDAAFKELQQANQKLKMQMEDMEDEMDDLKSENYFLQQAKETMRETLQSVREDQLAKIDNLEQSQKSLNNLVRSFFSEIGYRGKTRSKNFRNKMKTAFTPKDQPKRWE